MQWDSLVSYNNVLVLQFDSFILLEQNQPHEPAVFICFVRCGTNAAVLNLVPHSVVIDVVTVIVERYQVYQHLFICLGIS